jgi:hypothetical protein
MARRADSIQEQEHRINRRCFAYQPTGLRMSKRDATPKSAKLAGFGCASTEYLVEAMMS